MTIAAGFVCNNGVLLCTDTQHTAYPLKYDAVKSEDFDFPGGKLAFAYAGNTNFALSAIQKCQRHMKAKKRLSDPLAEVEGVLEKEYQRTVLRHPDRNTDGSIHYWLLLALWLPSSGVKLYATHQNSLHEVKGYECIGSGQYLAQYLIEPAYVSGMDDWKAMVTASHALAAAKNHVDGCGGMSILIFIKKDGRIGLTTSAEDGPSKYSDNFSRQYEHLTAQLVSLLTDDEVSDAAFENYLSKYYAPVLLDAHKQWRADRRKREEEFMAANRRLSATEAVKLYHQLSMGIAPDQPPSQA
jgi:hypothetical protein